MVPVAREGHVRTASSGDAYASIASGRRGTPLFRRRRLRNFHPRALLADSSTLASEAAQVEELGPTHTPAPNDRHIGEHRTVRGEDALDTDAVGDLADRERGAHPATATGDADALEGLNALLVTLPNANVHLDGVAGAERGQVLHPLLLGFGKRVHIGSAESRGEALERDPKI